MNINNFWIEPSKKSGLASEESYIVGRGMHVFLRILGKEPSWEIMTATASEDDGRLNVFPDRARLVEAAFKIANMRNFKPIAKVDLKNREYIIVCALNQDRHETDEEFKQDLKNFAIEFFEIFDNLPDLEKQARNEMMDIYESLSVDNSMEDIYLSDGVWLSSDGFVEDRGR